MPTRSPPSLAAAAAGPRVSAARRPRPHVSLPPLAAAAAGPRKSALLFLFSTPRMTTARQSPDSNGRADQGVMPEPWPCPPWRSAHANHPRPASRSMRSARSSAVRRGARSTGYKSPSPRALAIVHHPPPLVAIRCAPEPRERREKGKEGEEESAKAAVEGEVVGAEDDASTSSPTWLGTALHGHTGAARPRIDTASPSSLPRHPR